VVRDDQPDARCLARTPYAEACRNSGSSRRCHLSTGRIPCEETQRAQLASAGERYRIVEGAVPALFSHQAAWVFQT
jgi:hypothetical protein